MNVPNQLTVSRFVLTAAFLVAVFVGYPRHEIVALLLFSVASLTDYFDGRIARRDKLITNFGILMDPLADKILVCSVFIAFVGLRWLPAWMAVVVIGREFLVSGLRSIAASEGFTIQASELGKFKMLVQIISVVAVILARRWHEWPVVGIYIFPVYWIAWIAIWFMVLLSLISAVDYFIAFWSRIDRKSEKRRRRSFVLARRRKSDVQAV